MRDVTELAWGERTNVESAAGSVEVAAFRVKHWAPGCNAVRFVVTTDTSWSARAVASFSVATQLTRARLRRCVTIGATILAIMAIGAYDPWIRAHATPEEVVEMCDASGVDYILPVHHQTFRLSYESFREPIERLERALRTEPHRIALREIGETFVIPEYDVACSLPEVEADAMLAALNFRPK